MCMKTYKNRVKNETSRPIKEERGENIMGTNALEIIDLCVNVNGKELLHKINLTIPAGEVHSLFGQNGSGKTSLMMAIMGFSAYKVTSGKILFEGKDVTPLNLTERSRLGIGIAQQRAPTLCGIKLRSVVEYISKERQHKKDEIDEIVSATKTHKFLDRDVNDGLSGGEIKRSEIMQLLAMKPVFSMLDEPDSGLDIESLSLLGGLINKIFSNDVFHPVKRNAGLIITHNGNVLEHVNVDKAHVMINGRIDCSGNPRIIMDTISKYGYEECVNCIERGV